jgi:hypothetical protein
MESFWGLRPLISHMSQDKLRVYITVDTETSMGGAWRNPKFAPLPLERTVFGEHKGRLYGIPLLMDILEEYGFRATFFTEVFCADIVGRDELKKVFQCIQDRGHDAQLHLHPTYKFYADFLAGGPRRETDLMFQLSAEEQRELIGQGMRLFAEMTGKLPRAYRAGCYGASEVTLKALHANGIEIDSSYNLAYLGSTCGFQTPALNAPTVIEGVYEFPVTVFRVTGTSGYKPLEISAVSRREVLGTILSLKASGCRDAVLSLHSFSLLKNRGERYDNCLPDRIVIQRLRNLCSSLAILRDEVEILVFGDLPLQSIPVSQRHPIPSMGLMRPAVRKLVQGLNRLAWI